MLVSLYYLAVQKHREYSLLCATSRIQHSSWRARRKVLRITVPSLRPSVSGPILPERVVCLQRTRRTRDRCVTGHILVFGFVAFAKYVGIVLLQSHEEIDWSSSPATLAATSAFRDTVIHPHIFQQVHAPKCCTPRSLTCYKRLLLYFFCIQDGKSLDFLYYLDFLRALPKDYAAMTTAYASTSSTTTSNNSSGRGGPSAVKVTGGAAKEAAGDEDFEK